MRHSRLSVSFFLVLLIAAPAPAQSGAAAPPDLRVQATLRNGHAIVGVALAGRLSEKAVRSGFETSEDRSHRRTGVRIWYYRNLDGFIFLPHRTVARLDVLGTLTPAESRALREAVARARTASRSAGPPGRAGASTRPELRRPGTEGGSRKTGAGEGGLTAEELALLKEFPPEKGWGARRFGEIQRRKIVLHIPPSARERRFVEVYPRWERAFRKWQKLKQGEEDGSGIRPPSAPPDGKPPRRKGLGHGGLRVG